MMPDDAQGIKTIYPGGSTGGQLQIMTAELPAVGLDRDYTTNLEASGGTGGYRWDLVSGQMPPGMQFGMSGMLFGTTNAPGNYPFVAQVRDSAGNASQSSFVLVVKQPGLGPTITSAYFKKKKVFLTGTNFEADTVVYVDEVGLSTLSAAPDGTSLMTQKKKQKPGLHLVYVINRDGKQSPRFQFVIE